MLLREVEYARPATVEEAIALLGSHEGARPLAGGQTIVNVMKARAAAPDVLVDLADLDELRAIGFSSEGLLEVGAPASGRLHAVAALGDAAACRIEFDLRYGFSSAALESLVSPVFDHIANTLVDSFVRRAEQIHGPR